MKLKLGFFAEVHLRNNRDSDNKSILEKIKKEQRRVRLAKKHVALSFWQDLIVQHHLVGGVCDALVAPEMEQSVSKQLDRCLRQAHHPNPALKTSQPLVRMMAFMEQPNATEMFGLCKGSFESPSLSRTMSRIVCESLLKLIGRTRCDLAYPIYWSHLKSHFDAQLCQNWSRSQAEHVSRAGFLRARRVELQLFIDMSLATNCGH